MHSHTSALLELERSLRTFARHLHEDQQIFLELQNIEVGNEEIQGESAHVDEISVLLQGLGDAQNPVVLIDDQIFQNAFGGEA